MYHTDHPTFVLKGEEIENILRSVDAFEHLGTPHDAPEKTLLLHYFGVFRPSDYSSLPDFRAYESIVAVRNLESDISHSPPTPVGSRRRAAEEAFIDTDQNYDSTWTTSLNSAIPSSGNVTAPTLEWLRTHNAGDSDTADRHFNETTLSAGPSALQSLYPASTAWEDTTSCILGTINGDNDFEYSQSTAQEPRGDNGKDIRVPNSPVVCPPVLRPTLDSLHIPEQDRYLMRYYIEKVVQLSTVIENAKSPWKTIHLPRALQGIGELGIGRPASRIRCALRNDLLAISAFQLANDHQINERSEEAAKWSRAASRYRYSAIALLNQAMRNDLDPHHRPKYKDFLATMLSMISINVSPRR